MEQKIEEMESKRKDVLRYAKAMTNMPLDKVVTTKQKNKMIQKYDKETIRTYLENPSSYEAKLREVVDYLCTISPQFCRLIEYIPNMALITPSITQKMSMYATKKKKETEKCKTDFAEMCDYTDMLDMKSTGMRILKEVFKYGVFFGIEIEGEYSIYVKRLDPSLCKIITEGELGLGIAFDFSYFDNNDYILKNAYPKEFQKLYKEYKANKKPFPNLESKWQPVPIELTFVVKHDLTHLDYSVPPYVNIFSSLYDLEEYQSLNKAKVTAENYTLIGLKIPTLSGAKDADDYAVSNDMIDATTEQLEESLPPYMGYFTTATDIETIKASTSSDSKIDNVSNAKKNVWNDGGFAEAIFGIDNTNSGTLDYSIKTDEQQLFPLYKQLQNHWNVKLKKKYKGKFKLKLLDTTWFNIKTLLEQYTSASQLTIPVLLMIPLLLGFEMSDVDDMATMQEDIFDVFNKWKAPQSSFTTSGKDITDKGGSPTKDPADITSSGETTRRNDSNKKK